MLTFGIGLLDCSQIKAIKPRSGESRKEKKKMNQEKIIEMEKALRLVMDHFPTHINAEIAAYAMDDALGGMKEDESDLSREIQEIAEMQIAAAIEVEAGNTGVANFLSMIQKIQARA